MEEKVKTQEDDPVDVVEVEACEAIDSSPIANVNDSDNSEVTQNGPETSAAFAPIDESITLDEIKLCMEKLMGLAENIASSSAKTAGEIRDVHKLYHNEYVKRLSSMQAELDTYHKIEKSRHLDGILTGLSELYNNYISVANDVSDEKLKKRLNYMFDDLQDILNANGASMLKSKLGDKRNIRHCQVIERIYTDNHELHDTIVKSRNTGFYIESRTLIKEMVDVYIYSEKTEKPNQAVEETNNSTEE
jgi:hypothetical protein